MTQELIDVCRWLEPFRYINTSTASAMLAYKTEEDTYWLAIGELNSFSKERQITKEFFHFSRGLMNKPMLNLSGGTFFSEIIDLLEAIEWFFQQYRIKTIDDLLHKL